MSNFDFQSLVCRLKLNQLSMDSQILKIRSLFSSLFALFKGGVLQYIIDRKQKTVLNLRERLHVIPDTCRLSSV